MPLFYKKYRFSPKWYFVVITLLLFTLFIQLGCWQLERAASKAHLQEIFTERLQATPLSLDSLPQEDKGYYPVRVTGQYDNAHTVLLDNKIYAHQVGYEVLTPFLPKGGQQTVLINRGWIPAAESRNQLPVVPAATGEHTIVGYVYTTPGKPFTLGQMAEPNTTWPVRIQALDMQFLQQIMQRPLYPFVLLLAKDQQMGFVRDWQPVASAANKNTGYAVQWFTFAGVLIIIFLALSIRKSK